MACLLTAAVNIRVLEGSEAVARAAADFVTQAASVRPEIVLALPTGGTPIPFYNELAERHARGEADLSLARGFNLDELIVPAGDPRSFQAFMARYVWGRTGLLREHCDIPDGTAPDPEMECQRYEGAIQTAGGIDLAILGLGADGHVAFNLPGSPVCATHVVRLPDGLAASLAPKTRPLRAITMGLSTLRGSRSILVLATGSSKARAVRALVEGPRTPEWPCSLLRDHPSLEVCVDCEAGSALA